jgi:hypothetical protein
MKLQYQPEKVGKIIIACVILHNIAVDCRDLGDYEPDPNYVDNVPNVVNNQAGNAMRNAFVQVHFS